MYAGDPFHGHDSNFQIEFESDHNPDNDNILELRLGYEDPFGLILSPPVIIAVEYVGYFCFAGNCLVNVLDNRIEGVESNRDDVVRKRISDIEVGDLVQSGSHASQFRPVLAVVRTQRQSDDERFDMVRVNEGCNDEDLLVTRGHPVRLRSHDWIRPESVGEAFAMDIDEVYNFVVEGRGSIWVNSIECASLGTV